MPKLVYPRLKFSGDILRIRRTNDCFSMNQLAKKIGCSRTAILNWETGKFQPGPRYLSKISKVFKTAVATLMVRDDAKN